MDVDIDLVNRDELLALLDHIPASISKNGIHSKHNTGVYFQSIPLNPFTGAATFDHKVAASRGYFKIDLLNMSAYNGVNNEAHLIALQNKEPEWSLLQEKDICDKLVHINGYHTLLKSLKPTSIVELAIVLALIRPGKKHLIDKCIRNGFKSVEDEIWEKSIDQYAFKKAHAISYSHLIIVQLNLLCETLLNESS